MFFLDFNKSSLKMLKLCRAYCSFSVDAGQSVSNKFKQNKRLQGLLIFSTSDAMLQYMSILSFFKVSNNIYCTTLIDKFLS